MQENALSCRELVKLYGSQMALDGADLEIHAGRITGLLGPNGSGKTTLLKLANGLLVPDHGSVEIFGQRPGPASKAFVSYLPDAEYLPDYMRIRDLVKMYHDFYADFDEQRCVNQLIELNLNGKSRLKELSRGTREKVQLVLVMSRSAKLFLLDEPIGGVDPAAREYILNTILKNRPENSAILISTHLIRDVEDILDDVVFMWQGRAVQQRSVQELRATEGKSVDEYFREVFRV